MPLNPDRLLKRLKDADSRARRRFHYRKDPGPDTWRSHRALAETGRDWFGDCDDLASTTLDILINSYPMWPEQDEVARLCFRLKVATLACPKDAPYDHMVAGVQLPDGQFWIIGDTFGEAMRREASEHRIVSWSCLADGNVWRRGDPSLGAGVL